jgi:hypothetical protein
VCTRRERHRTGDRDDVDDVRGRAAPEAGCEGAQAPDAAEVVDRGHPLDPLGVDVEEAAAGGNARVVDEEAERRVTGEDAGGDLVHLRPVGDVADLPLPADLPGDPLQPLGSPGEQHAAPPAPGELARGRLADPRGGARDDCDPFAGHGRSSLASRPGV